MLEVQQLSFDYADQPLLNQIQFSLAPGQLLHLCGENGAGKTTLLKLLAGLFPPTDGTIYFQQQDIQTDRARYQQQLCYVGHKTGISQFLTWREQIQWDWRQSSQSPTLEALRSAWQLNIPDDNLNGLLSSGQKRRVALMRLQLSAVPLWLLDEPFVGLDHASVNYFVGVLQQHVQQGGAVILSSHHASALAGLTVQEYHL